MAQPAPAPQTAPSATIKIKNGQADQEKVYILVGEYVEFHNEDNTPYELPFNIVGSTGDTQFPLSIYLPPGGKLDLFGNASATCTYNVAAAPFMRGKGGEPMSGPYTIGVGSGDPGGGGR